MFQALKTTQKFNYDDPSRRTRNDAGTSLFTGGNPALTKPELNQYVVSTSSGFIHFALYEAYGTRPTEWGDDPDRQKANTKEEETDLGLLNEGMRYRDLETGVFLTRDPIGYQDGPNIYCYVHCNPITQFDPFGLKVVFKPSDLDPFGYATQSAIDTWNDVKGGIDSDTLAMLENPEITVVVQVVAGVRNVVIGAAPYKAIDIKDIKELPKTDAPLTQSSAMVHELVEQYQIQIEGESEGSAHKTAIVAENKESGYERGKGKLQSHELNEDQSEVTTTIGYKAEDGHTVTVTLISDDKGNFTYKDDLKNINEIREVEKMDAERMQKTEVTD